MFATSPLASRPLSAGPRYPRPFRIGAVVGEYGFAAWSYSRQAKLNAWGWHGVGPLGSVNSWATLGNTIYMRNESNSYVYMLQPDTFLGATDANGESASVEATTQWLDFGKPGKMKALSGIDFDAKNIDTVEVYVFVPNPLDKEDRTGTLATSIPLSDAATGWTYSGEIIPLEEVGAATEFQIRFVGSANEEVQLNRLTIHWDEVQG